MTTPKTPKTTDMTERKPKAQIAYEQLGRISQQLRRFSARLDEDEDNDMLDDITTAIALVRSVRGKLDFSPSTTSS